jgi:hypothetical protein
MNPSGRSTDLWILASLNITAARWYKLPFWPLLFPDEINVYFIKRQNRNTANYGKDKAVYYKSFMPVYLLLISNIEDS